MSDEIAFVVPGRIDQLTGGYLFERHIVEGLRARGRSVRVIELSGRNPTTDGAMIAALPDGTKTVVDGLALANLGDVVAAQAHRVRFFAVLHGPGAVPSGHCSVLRICCRAKGTRCSSRRWPGSAISTGGSPASGRSH